MKEEFKEYIYDDMLYKVSNYGRVFGKRKELSQRINVEGYIEVTMGRVGSKRTRVRVHRLVAILFVPNYDNLPEVNHIDMDRKNPRADNLEWVTHQQNISHSHMNGRYKDRMVGSKNIKATFTEKDIIEIRRLYDNGTRICDIVKLYNSKWSTINNIVKRLTWTHIQNKQ